MPQRFLRPGITTSSAWNKVSHAAGSLFIRLLTIVDDFGRCDGRISVIHGHAFAVWNEENPDEEITTKECAALCSQLEDKGLVRLYKAEGRKVLQITQWQEKPRSDKSKFPDPETLNTDSCLSASIPLESAPSLGPRSSVIVNTPSPSSDEPAIPPRAEDGGEKVVPFSDGVKPPRLPTTAQSQRVAAIMHKRVTTGWDDKEYKAYRELGVIDPEDLAAVERYYSRNWPPRTGVNILRHDLVTLLNNWSCEVQRAYADDQRAASPSRNSGRREAHL